MRVLRRTSYAVLLAVAAAGVVASPAADSVESATAGSGAPPPVQGAVVEMRHSKYGSWLTVRDLLSTERRPLTPPPREGQPRQDWAPSWSNDGTRIAFVRSSNARCDVFTVNPDGTGQQRVAVVRRPPRSTCGVGYIRWSPDDSALALAVAGDPRASYPDEIYRVGVDGSGLRLVTRTRDGFLELLGWSPDGSQLLVSDIGGEPLHPGRAKLETVTADAPTLTHVLLSAGSIDVAEWSPDGGRIKLDEGCYRGVCRLETLSPATGAVTPLTHFTTGSGSAPYDTLDSIWRAPTGTILYAHRRTIYEATPATGGTRIVGTVPCPRKRCYIDDVEFGGISPDGRYAVFDLDDYPLLDTGQGSVRRAYALDVDNGVMTTIPLYAGAIHLG